MAKIELRVYDVSVTVEDEKPHKELLEAAYPYFSALFHEHYLKLPVKPDEDEELELKKPKDNTLGGMMQ